jgi:hypothetical protein
MTGFGHSGHGGQEEHADRSPGGAGDPERTVHGAPADPQQTVWGGAASPAQPSSSAPWEEPVVDYPHSDIPPSADPFGPAGYQPLGHGGAPYQPPPPAPPPPMQYGAPAAGYQPYPYGAGNYASAGTNGLAIGSLVSSILGLLCCQIAGIVAIALGIVALNQIKRTNQDGHGLAIAGIVIGGLSTALMVVILILYAGSYAR